MNLGSGPCRNPAVVAEPFIGYPPTVVDMLTRLFFNLSVPAIMFVNSAVLLATATGKAHGMVVSVGPKYAWIIPVVNREKIGPFRVDIGNKKVKGLVLELLAKLTACKKQYHQALRHNIILSGENSADSKFEKEFTKELQTVLGNDFTLVLPEDRFYDVVLSGAALAKSSDFKSTFTKAPENSEADEFSFYRWMMWKNEAYWSQDLK